MSISYTNNIYGDYILGSTISANNSQGWAVGLAVTSGFIWSRHGVYDTCKAQLNPNKNSNSIQLVWPANSSGGEDMVGDLKFTVLVIVRCIYYPDHY